MCIALCSLISVLTPITVSALHFDRTNPRGSPRTRRQVSLSSQGWLNGQDLKALEAGHSSVVSFELPHTLYDVCIAQKTLQRGQVGVEVQAEGRDTLFPNKVLCNSRSFISARQMPSYHTCLSLLHFLIHTENLYTSHKTWLTYFHH